MIMIILWSADLAKKEAKYAYLCLALLVCCLVAVEVEYRLVCDTTTR